MYQFYLNEKGLGNQEVIKYNMVLLVKKKKKKKKIQVMKSKKINIKKEKAQPSFQMILNMKKKLVLFQTSAHMCTHTETYTHTLVFEGLPGIDRQRNN